MEVKNETVKLGLAKSINPHGRPLWNSFDGDRQESLLRADLQAGVVVSLILTGSFVTGLMMIALAVFSVV